MLWMVVLGGCKQVRGRCIMTFYQIKTALERLRQIKRDGIKVFFYSLSTDKQAFHERNSQR